MDAAALIKLAAVLSICLVVVSIGLRARPADALALLRTPALAARALLAMFVAVPLFVMAVVFVLPLDPAVRAALIALSVSPMPPILPNKQAKAGGDGDYIIGLQVLATLASIIIAPLYVALAGQVFGQDTLFSAGPMLKVLVMTVGAPLALGMLVNHLAPGLAAKLAGPIGKLGMAALAIAGVLILIGSWPLIIAAIGNGTLVAVALITGWALLAGHLLGGPDEGNRGALAVACAARHPGVAIGVATMSLAAQAQQIVGAVLLALVAGIVFTLPYMRWRKAAMAPS